LGAESSVEGEARDEAHRFKHKPRYAHSAPLGLLANFGDLGFRQADSELARSRAVLAGGGAHVVRGGVRL
jgi:hypothetical protein